MAVKNWVVGCWRGYLSGARCRLGYGPADASATHCLFVYVKSRCLTFLVLAHPGSPGKRAVKREHVCVTSCRWIYLANGRALWMSILNRKQLSVGGKIPQVDPLCSGQLQLHLAEVQQLFMPQIHTTMIGSCGFHCAAPVSWNAVLCDSDLTLTDFKLLCFV